MKELDHMCDGAAMVSEEKVELKKPPTATERLERVAETLRRQAGAVHRKADEFEALSRSLRGSGPGADEAISQLINAYYRQPADHLFY
jgi:hypothetical protein